MKLTRTFAVGAAVLFSGALAAQAGPANPTAPDFGLYADLGAPLSAAQITVASTPAPAEGSNDAVKDGSIATYVRHDPEKPTFTFTFAAPQRIKGIRIYSDIVDAAVITVYNGETQLAQARISQPVQTISHDGSDKEYYALRFNGAGLVTRVDVELDYYSDADATKHRFYYADFLVQPAGSAIQMTGGQSMTAKLEGNVKLVTVRGPLAFDAAEISSLQRVQNNFVVRLANGSVLTGLPADAEVKIRNSDGSSSLSWSQIQGYVSDRSAASAAPQGQLAFRLKSGDVIVGQLTGLSGKAIRLADLENIQIDPARVTGLTMNTQTSYLIGDAAGVGDVIFSRDAAVKVRVLGQNLSLSVADLSGATRELGGASSELLENLPPVNAAGAAE